MKDEVFRRKLNEQLPKGIKLDAPSNRPKPADYRIVYAIATVKDIPRRLPFFSKVTLKNAMSNLGVVCRHLLSTDKKART
ncbi:hypothetical protein GNZ12_24445 [Paraburkholderia sp. 1N]|uniref:Uncharacterized protein n=1 Tax=Paraburkholderia solitsugae TaxID=2675748 RepID=A0ABX2BUJ1_9BURK|nr:hypothetical protein [Paraburkholderia solitsugae]